MKLFVIAIFDHAMQAYTPPSYFAAVGQALRGFQDQVNDPKDDNNPVAKHPEDYDLFKLAEYDDSTGIFSFNVPELLLRGKEVKIPT
jgi:hypothetical protein